MAFDYMLGFIVVCSETAGGKEPTVAKPEREGTSSCRTQRNLVTEALLEAASPSEPVAPQLGGVVVKSAS